MPLVTLGDVASRVCKDLLHDNALFDVALDHAREIYVRYASSIPFNSLRKRTTGLAVQSDVAEYSLDAWQTDVAGITSLRINFSSTNGRRLIKKHPREFDQFSAVGTSRPSIYYRWGDDITLYPTPNSAAYTLDLRYWAYPTIDEANLKDHELQTPREWASLYMWETYYELLNGVMDQPDKAMLLMAPSMVPSYPSTRTIRSHGDTGIIPRLLNSLLKTVDQRDYVDDQYSIKPIQMSYTHASGGY